MPYFYDCRIENLNEIITSAISSGADDVYIINNSDNQFVSKDNNVFFINTGKNFGCSIRLSIASLIDSDLIICHDDDLALGKESINLILKYFGPARIVGFCGAFLGNKEPYLDRLSLTSPPEPVNPDVVLGRLMAFSPKRVCDLYGVFSNLDRSEWFNHDDIAFSLANKLIGGENLIVDLKTMELKDGDYGLHTHDPNHFIDRNSLAKKILKNEDRRNCKKL